MDKVFVYMIIKENMKGVIRMDLSMDLVKLLCLIKMCMKEIGKKIKCMGKQYLLGQMVENMMEIG